MKKTVVSERTCVPDFKARWTSPGCRAATMSPIPHANYRETNASRLRQEIKGMTITGFIRNGTRSSSSSPSKKKSGNSSPTRSLSGDHTSPKRKDSDRTIDLGSTPRTMSETSNSSRDTQDKFKAGVSHSGNVCDTDTNIVKETNTKANKIMNSIKAAVLNRDRDSPSTARICPSTNIKVTSVLSNLSNVSCKGYGKPLVTPMNKKLSIRRDYPFQEVAPRATESNHVKLKPSVIPRPASPVVSRQPTPKPVSKLPVKTNGIHRAPFNTSPKLSENLGKQQLPTKETPTTSANSTNGDIPNILKKKSLDVRSRSIAKPQRPTSGLATRFDRSKERNYASDHKPKDFKNVSNRNKNKPMHLTPDPAIENPDSVSVTKVTPVKQSLTRIPMKIHSENSIKHRKFSTEKLKQQFCRDTPVYAAGRPNSAIHSVTRTFKPQLEDIKSSYLLLNKRELEHEKTLKAKPNALADGGVEKTVVHEPRVLDDNERKAQLHKIKEKFKSRRFYHDSRYDKIEGLNWISWKD